MVSRFECSGCVADKAPLATPAQPPSLVAGEVSSSDGIIGECDEKVVEGWAVTLERMGFEPLPPATLTSFHCVRPPAISICEYVARVREHFVCSIECYVLAFTYLDRLLNRHPHITLCALSRHRLFFCSMMLAAKFQDDVFYSNTYYAKVAGLRLKDLNALEQDMLQLLDYRLFVQPDEFEASRRMLCKAAVSDTV